MRDQRDPTALGEAYLGRRAMGLPIEQAVLAATPDYTDNGLMSNDPAQHHSKTPQNLGDLDDGGAS